MTRLLENKVNVWSMKIVNVYNIHFEMLGMILE